MGKRLLAPVPLAEGADALVVSAVPGEEGSLDVGEDGVLLEVGGHAGRWWFGQERPGLLEVPGGVSGGVESEVPDLSEALGEDVEEEASDELGSVEPDDTVACMVAVQRRGEAVAA